MKFNCEWPLPPTNPYLFQNDVHIWCICMNQFDNHVEPMTSILSPIELQRAERFRYPHHRRRYIVFHGLLRKLLADYTKIESDKIIFRYNQYGKPFLSKRTCEEKIRFNISHSNEYALFAFAYEREIGVDIQQIYEIADMDKVAEQIFSPNEITFLQLLSNSEKKEAFFQLWTRKEAYIKATGLGFSAELVSIDISSNLLNSSLQISTGNCSADSNGWIVHDLNPVPGYAAAFAIEGDAEVCQCWRIPNDF